MVQKWFERKEFYVGDVTIISTSIALLLSFFIRRMLRGIKSSPSFKHDFFVDEERTIFGSFATKAFQSLIKMLIMHHRLR